jgi:hypothetical protein
MTVGSEGFAQKALIVILGVIGSLLLAFFAWLATAVIEVREHVVRMDANLESLLATRTESGPRAIGSQHPKARSA